MYKWIEDHPKEILIALWMLGILIGFAIFFLLLCKNADKSLLGALAVLVSALIASTSVILNIKKTRELKIFELRKGIFEEVGSFITDASINGKPTVDKISDFARKTRIVHFLFSTKINQYIDDIINKASSQSFEIDWFQQERVSGMNKQFEDYFNEYKDQNA